MMALTLGFVPGVSHLGSFSPPENVGLPGRRFLLWRSRCRLRSSGRAAGRARVLPQVMRLVLSVQPAWSRAAALARGGAFTV